MSNCRKPITAEPVGQPARYQGWRRTSSNLHSTMSMDRPPHVLQLSENARLADTVGTMLRPRPYSRIPPRPENLRGASDEGQACAEQPERVRDCVAVRCAFLWAFGPCTLHDLHAVSPGFTLHHTAVTHYSSAAHTQSRRLLLLAHL